MPLSHLTKPLRHTPGVQTSYIEISRFFQRQSIGGNCLFNKQAASAQPLSSSVHRSEATTTLYPAHFIAQPERDKAGTIVAFKKSLTFPKATHEFHQLSNLFANQEVVLHGFLGHRFDLSKNLSFVSLISKSLDYSVQIVSDARGRHDEDTPHAKLRKIEPQSPVVVTGILKAKEPSPSPDRERATVKEVELKLSHVQCLNPFPKRLIGSIEDVFGPEERHLQIRSDKGLRHALLFRARLASLCRDDLDNSGFVEVETPLLFKSTSEGAREFLVPTRRKGMAYALPQSPQQFKQILMGSGIPKYYQIAKCFRDEDLRADRQPEFTQLDLEMSFASGAEVTDKVTGLVKSLWKLLLSFELPETFAVMTYNDAMSQYGSDKPDLRVSSRIVRIEHFLPTELKSKLTSLPNPIIEAFALNLKTPSGVDDSPVADVAQTFIRGLLESPSAASFNTNPHGAPGIFVFNPLAPLRGLSALGFEAASSIEEIFEPDEGTLIVLQARPKEPFSGGSTALGNLRSQILKAAFKQKILEPESRYAPLWITEFPLFTATKHDPEEGQGSPTGLSSTHHPFTAPLNSYHTSLVSDAPDKALADHYDLVINGVELGGGSRRIHSAAFQEYILRDVLSLSEARMKEFEHLLKVLKAGCPPHAGFALGFDRLVALMLGKDSVRDVIAFPKGSGGEDKFVGSPATIKDEELERYGLQLRDKRGKRNAACCIRIKSLSQRFLLI